MGEPVGGAPAGGVEEGVGLDFGDLDPLREAEGGERAAVGGPPAALPPPPPDERETVTPDPV